MASIAYPARAVGRRRLSRRLGSAGPLTYLALVAVAIGSIFPLYWSLVVASHDNEAVAAYPPVLTPGGQLWHNIKRLFSSGEVNVSFWHALVNTTIIAATVTTLETIAELMSAVQKLTLTSPELKSRERLCQSSPPGVSTGG